MATTAKAAPAVDASREFALQQYLTLRDEIKETKDRLFKVMTFGIVGVPAANYLSDRFKIPEVLLALPVLVLIIALMYLAENHGLMRCGRFIRTEIEPRYPEVRGWERWLEESDERRSVDRYVASLLSKTAAMAVRESSETSKLGIVRAPAENDTPWCCLK